ncbi:hypothetical protein D3C73_1010750 [compost metagenome]
MQAQLELFYRQMPAPAGLQADASPQRLWSGEHREQQAELLQAVAALEQRADELTCQVLEHRGLS